MPNDDYSYAMEMWKEDGASLGQAPLDVDWAPAREWGWFQALRAGRPVHEVAGAVETGVEPIWHARLGEPYVGGLRLIVPDPPRDDHVSEITLEYFRRQARDLSLHLKDEGLLEAGDRYAYSVVAFPQVGSATEETSTGLTVETEAQALDMDEAEISVLRRRAAPVGVASEGDMPLFVPRTVLREVLELTTGADGVETGGVLIGHLRRDGCTGEVFVEITAQIPVRCAIAEEASLTFTTESWNQARASIALRGRRESMIGWWHSHPIKTWCRDCPPEKRRDCPLLVDYFSDQDRLLHRTVFPAAYGVALVVNELADDRSVLSMFGWREGVLQQRGYDELDPAGGGMVESVETAREGGAR